MKFNWNLVVILLILLVLVLGVFLILRGRPEPVVVTNIPEPVVEWKEKIVPVVKWKEVQMPVPYYIYLPGSIDTLWLSSVGYAVFDTTHVISTVFNEKELSGLLQVSVNVYDSVSAYLDDEVNVYLDKVSKLSLLNYELVRNKKIYPLEVELRFGVSLNQDEVNPHVGLGLLKNWGVVYIDASNKDIGLGLGVRF